MGTTTRGGLLGAESVVVGDGTDRVGRNKTMATEGQNERRSGSVTYLEKLREFLRVLKVYLSQAS